jgi:peroxiredoxin
MVYLQITFLSLFLFFSGSAMAMGHLASQAVDSPMIGKTAPDVVLSKTDGKSAGVMASRQGKKAILVFWATWCPHCYEELGFINQNFAAIEQKGIKIILLDEEETAENVRKYFDQRQMKLVSFLDEDGYLQGAYHLIGVPTMMFVDEKGVIRSMTHVFPSDYGNYFSVN